MTHTSPILEHTFQENAHNPPSGPRHKFRPYACPNHRVTKGRYITSSNPRGYTTVYEYPLNGQWIMMDIDDGYILWTGIWKALGNSKADIVKMIDSQPDLAPVIRRVRGGYLKIQGTWLPYEVALQLAQRVAWPLREDLVPLFGPTFPSTCLSPIQPGYGQVVTSVPGRRRAPRKSSLPNVLTTTDSVWSVVTPESHTGSLPSSAYLQYVPFNAHSEGYQQEILPSSDRHPSLPPSMQRNQGYSRYAPYPDPSCPPSSKQSTRETPLALQTPLPAITKLNSHAIKLPPISQAGSNHHGAGSVYALPPISALEDLRWVDVDDSAAVLRRLSQNDESDI
ncbi:transcription regulator HTH, apses-type DNA-binding domain-containing protein [Lentinula aciculospora]|uniref:Transcription regulator HTH, apses-type DNA-binding domain-containing protein n=1 Tax=Lentinula aciculospora TaxID=153920 RepID=A0A9W9A6W8_9AGAR|nr:transcription regulator HTH, apses-type DNA-binding domain-containing protein [Lentinula aciculospora]